MASRLIGQRRRFFFDPVMRQWEHFNCLDLTIVVACSVDLYSQSGPAELSAMRLVRFVRLARAFRVLRVMTSFSKLRILLRTTASSFASLFWAMVLISSSCTEAPCPCARLCTCRRTTRWSFESRGRRGRGR
mmetsp:Transcript_63884/g.178760  ORF Transcript_63884/g.178760 Transcript_63884/m.178760 type:complete len:132 (+) Transcript_63884:490-885(+)